jgi:hypothetical protein
MMGSSRRAAPAPAPARGLACRLSALFERDVEIVERLNDAQRRLYNANERLWSGVSRDSFGLVYDGSAPAGVSQIAVLMTDACRAGGSDVNAAALCVLQETHCAIRSGFHAYQAACEERRQLAFEVGELSRQLTDVLCAAGWSVDEARSTDVHELARAGGRSDAR